MSLPSLDGASRDGDDLGTAPAGSGLLLLQSGAAGVQDQPELARGA